MTQEDKELLLKDLCARLPYDAKVKYWPDSSIWGKYISPETCLLTMDILTSVFKREYSKKACLPYLRPMSSMTEEERKEYKHLVAFSGSPGGAANFIDWLNKKMFDYNTDEDGKTMIEKGLALEAPEGMYEYEKDYPISTYRLDDGGVWRKQIC